MLLGEWTAVQMEAGSPGGGHCRDLGERWRDTEGLDWRINVLEVLVVGCGQILDLL